MSDQETLAQGFGRLVRRLRKERWFSQEEFAFRVGVNRTYMGDKERGEKKDNLVTKDKLARGN